MLFHHTTTLPVKTLPRSAYTAAVASSTTTTRLRLRLLWFAVWYFCTHALFGLDLFIPVHHHALPACLPHLLWFTPLTACHLPLSTTVLLPPATLPFLDTLYPTRSCLLPTPALLAAARSSHHCLYTQFFIGSLWVQPLPFCLPPPFYVCWDIRWFILLVLT